MHFKTSWGTLVALACSAALAATVGAPENRAIERRAIYADDAPPTAATEAPPRAPLMQLFDRANLAAPLDRAGINIGGFFEGSYTYNFDRPGNHLNNGRVFDFDDQDLTLNQIDLFIERAIAADAQKFDVGGRVEMMWGGDARVIHSTGLFDYNGISDGPDEQFDLVQAYLTANLPIGNGLLVKGGKFVTLLGYETINPTTNPLFSHTYLFGYAIPFTHTGVLATYALDKDWSVTGGVVRGWDQALQDTNESVSFLGQVVYTSEKFDLYVNAITGPEQADNNSDYRTVLDGTAVYRASEKLQFVLNGDFGWEPQASNGNSAVWYGAAGYAIYKVNDYLTAVGRVEYFNDDDGARGLGTSVCEATAGMSVRPLPNDRYGAGLVVRPEVRWDHAADNIFNDQTSGNQVTFGVDLLYSF